METKDIKLDSYILPERVKAKMILTLFETHQAKKEKSITFCSKLDNIIIAKGDLTGSSDTVEIDPRVCSKNEKFLGGYHTHVDRDSYASAEDLGHCGTLKILCTGGNDNKIRCNTWKDEQLSMKELKKVAYDIRKGMTKPENPRYQPNFDCIQTMNRLFLDEKYIKELDKYLDKKELQLLALKESGASENEIEETGIDLYDDTIKRDIRANRLKKEIKNESNKYYNEVEIK